MPGISDSGSSDLNSNQGADDEASTHVDLTPASQTSLYTFSKQREDGTEYDMTRPTGQNEYMHGTPFALSSIAAQQMPSFKRHKQTKVEDEAERQQLQQERQLNDNEKRTDNTMDSHQAILDKVDKIFVEAMEEETRQGKIRKKALDSVALKDSKHEELSNLCIRMKIAAETDMMANEQQKPATAKLKMLDEVAMTLSSSNLHDNILDNQVLNVIRMWLEPLPDHRLPSVHLQDEMLDILDKLPSSADHLRESGIAKIVNFYKKSTRVESRVQRKAEHLVAKWTRLVLRSSEHHHVAQEYNKDDTSHKRKPLRQEHVGTTKGGVSIPAPVIADYDIAPQSSVGSRKSQPLPQNRPFNRLKKKMRSLSDKTTLKVRKKKLLENRFI